MALAAAAALAGASVHSATGFGFALVASPALFAALEPHEALTALLVLGVALSLLVLFEGGRPTPVRWRPLAPALAAAAPGLAVGALALEALPKPGLQAAVGAAVLAAGAWQLRRRLGAAPGAARGPSPEDAGGGRAVAAGLASGALTTSISINGPPIVLWLESRRLAPAEVRASLAVFFLALNLAGTAVLLVTGGADRAVTAGVLLPLLALVVAGYLTGARVFRRLDERSFALVVLTLVAVSGAASLGAGLAGL